MKKSEFIILVDIDDVLEDLCSAWVDWLNNKYDLSVSVDDIDEWDISKFFPYLQKVKVFEPLYQEHFWYTVRVKPGAKEYLKRLYDEGFNIYLCTSTDYRNVRPKYEAIVERYFPFIKWKKIIVTNNKQLINGNVLIDDGVHNLENGNYKKILMSAPYNRSYDAKSNGMVRVENWEEAYLAIERMFEEENELENSTRKESETG